MLQEPHMNKRYKYQLMRRVDYRANNKKNYSNCFIIYKAFNLTSHFSITIASN